MEKIAANATPTTAELQKIAAFGFATVLGSPATGLKPEQVKAASARFVTQLKAASARHTNLVEVIRRQLPALLSPSAA